MAERGNGLARWDSRGVVVGRVNLNEQKAFILECHRDRSTRSKAKGKVIPITKLSQMFNEKFREVPVRSRSSLASWIGRDIDLSKLSIRLN